MGNMLTYLEEYGSQTFGEHPFGEVDNLVLSELAYLDLQDIVAPWGEGDPLPLGEAYRRYAELGRNDATEDNDPMPALVGAAASRRFGGCLLAGYEALTDAELELQYAAVTFLSDDGSACVVFRGTDNSIVGWREDFSVLYRSHTAGQQKARQYLETVAAHVTCPLVLCGHSKGGNLAMYAATYCAADVQKRVVRIYSNDGIGFSADIACSQEFWNMSSRMTLLVPQSSFVGALLENKENREVVLSREVGLRQHDPYSWEVTGDAFVRAGQRTQGSVLVTSALNEWLQLVDEQQRQQFVAAIFGAMEENGATTVSELNEVGVRAYAQAVARALKSMEPRLRRDAVLSIYKLGQVSGATIASAAAQQVKSLPSHLAAKKPQTPT